MQGSSALNLAKKYTDLMAAGSFQNMVFKSEDTTAGTVTYTITYLKSGSPFPVDITFKNGKDGLNGIDGATGTNGIDGADGPKVSGITFVDNDMVFAFNDGSTVSITDAKTTLKGEKGGSLVGPIERSVTTNGQDTYETAEHIVGSSALLVFAEGAKLSQTDYTEIDTTHIKLNADIANTLTVGMKVTTMFLSTMTTSTGETYTSAEKLKLAGLTGEPKGNLNASVAPTSTDDKTKGYSQGSTWIYNSTTYTCTDDTENGAIWTSSADIFYFDTWDLLVSAISVVGTTYVGKYAVVANANGGVVGGATYTAPTTLVNYIVDGGQATYKVNVQGTNYSVTCQARTVNNPTITSVMTIATTKPTVLGYYIFTVAPTNGLPTGVNLNDIAYYNGTNWSVFQSYAVANSVIVVGLVSASQTSWSKQNGTWISIVNLANYLYAERTTGQTTGLSANSQFIFTNVTKQMGSNFSLNTTTGVVTITGNSSYSIKSGPGVVMGASSSMVTYNLEKSTDGITWTPVGVQAVNAGTSFAYNYGRESTAHYILDNIGTTYIRTTINSISGTNSLGGATFGFPWIEVQEISRDVKINIVPAYNVIPTEWTTYTPTITSYSGTNPTLASATYKGIYKEVGKSLHVKVVINQNGTGTNGTGVYAFSIPNGYNINTTLATIPSTIVCVANNRSGENAIPLGTGRVCMTVTPLIYIGSTVVALSSNTLGLYIGINASSGNGCTLAGGAFFGAASADISYAFTAEIPIL